MRRLRVVLALAAVLLLAGCTGGLPAGVDGDLTNDWQAMTQPTVTVPVAGVCYAEEATTGAASGDAPTRGCVNNPHQVETVYVWSFTGDDAQRSSPPPIGGQARAAAYAGSARARPTIWVTTTTWAC